METTNTSTSTSITFITDDGLSVNIDSRIQNFSKLFSHIIADYTIDPNNTKPLININSKDLDKIINFIEIIDYDEDYIKNNLTKPFGMVGINNLKNNLFNSKPKLEEFFNNLNSKNISDYAKIADFFDIHQMEDILYLKLYEVFTNEENITSFFKEECDNIEDHMKINLTRQKYLREKYMIYCDKYVNSISDSEINFMLEKELAASDI
jgi:hypothetical protein